MKKDVLKVVTSNRGKFEEYKEKLEPYFEDIDMTDLEYPEIQADTLEEVVQYALEELKEHSPLIIDDSGLFIDSLNGFPGVYSAYVMDTIGCDGILSLMKDEKDRSARFQCVIGYLAEEKRLFKGVSEGTITGEKRGSKGFGYDPIFLPEDYQRTYAEMKSEEKNRISHRGAAMEEFLEFIKIKDRI